MLNSNRKTLLTPDACDDASRETSSQISHFDRFGDGTADQAHRRQMYCGRSNTGRKRPRKFPRPALKENDGFATLPSAGDGDAQARPERPGLGNAIPLREIDPDFAQEPDDPIAIDEFGDGFFAHDMADTVNRLDHGPVDGIVRHVLHETSVYFQK